MLAVFAACAQAVDGQPSARQPAVARWEATHVRISHSGPWTHGDPEVVVRAILAGAAYRPVVTTAKEERPPLLVFLWNELMDRIHAVFSAFVHALRGGKDAGTTLGIGLIVALLALLVFLLVRIIRSFTYARPTLPGAPVRAASVRAATSAQWNARALEAAGRHDYAAAIAALFNAALATLDERGVVTFDDARTPAEYVSLVRRAFASIPAAAAAFETVSRRFIVASFSRSASGAEEYDETLRAYSAFSATQSP